LIEIVKGRNGRLDRWGAVGWSWRWTRHDSARQKSQCLAPMALLGGPNHTSCSSPLRQWKATPLAGTALDKYSPKKKIKLKKEKSQLECNY